MKKILLNGVDGNFGSRSARVLLEKYPHEALIFTAPTKNGLEKYQAMGIETRIADAGPTSPCSINNWTDITN